jgi:cGMP-dependent protein kinase
LKSNDIAYKENYLKSSKIVIVIDGHLINSITKEIVANRGTILFQYELFQNSNDKTDYDIIPQPDCLLIEANTNDFLKELGGNFKELMAQTEIMKSLNKISIFRNLSSHKLDYIVNVISEEKFNDGDDIFRQGEEGDKFYIIKSGKVDILINNKYIRTLNEKEHFGERALFFNEKRSATIRAVGEVIVFSISKEDFEKNIEGNMKEHLMNRLYLQDNMVELKDLLFKMELGSGNYGNVCLVRNKKNKFPYAIKSISRNQINKEQLHLNLELERSILLKIDHPFIVKLVKSLKDKNNVYFLMEYIKGK